MVSFCSGGKESIYAICLALDSKIQIDYLIFTRLRFRRPSPHELNLKILTQIAQALEIPLVILDPPARKQSWIVTKLKELGAELIICGNLYIQEHREWWEAICRRAGVDYLEPLWNLDPCRALLEILRYGIKPMIVGLDTKYLPQDWLGAILDLSKAQDLLELASQRGFDPCGEHGEYHTIVLECPRFSYPIKVVQLRRIVRGGYHLLILDLNSETSQP